MREAIIFNELKSKDAFLNILLKTEIALNNTKRVESFKKFDTRNYNRTHERIENMLTKSEIRQICARNNMRIYGDFTMASKNKASADNDLYWANPSIDFLCTDWYFVLNDYQNRILYCFMIKANSIFENQVKTRVLNGRNLMDLQIKHINSGFIDIRSKINFSKYLIKTINY